MRPTTLLLSLFLSLPCLAAPPQVTPVPPPERDKAVELRCAAGELFVLAAQPASRWFLVDDGRAQLRVFDAGKSGAFVAPAGRYRVTVASPDGEVTNLVIVVGDAPPNPDPKPPEPKPDDPLVKELRALYAAEPVATRLKDMQALAALYVLMADESMKPEYPTAAAVNARYQAARDAMLKGALVAVRARLSREIAAAAGDDPDAPLTEVGRKQLAAAFARLSAAVAEACK